MRIDRDDYSFSAKRDQISKCRQLTETFSNPCIFAVDSIAESDIHFLNGPRILSRIDMTLLSFFKQLHLRSFDIHFPLSVNICSFSGKFRSILATDFHSLERTIS